MKRLSMVKKDSFERNNRIHICMNIKLNKQTSSITAEHKKKCSIWELFANVTITTPTITIIAVFSLSLSPSQQNFTSKLQCKHGKMNAKMSYITSNARRAYCWFISITKNSNLFLFSLFVFAFAFCLFFT